MRTAIITDVHGNYRALSAVLEDIERLGVSTIISLGDNVGYGPEPEEVVRLMVDRGITSIQGNHEMALNDAGYYTTLNPPTRLSLDITRSLLSRASLGWLMALPSFALRGNCRFVHGCPPDSATTYLLNPTGKHLEGIFAGFEESLCFAGHTHLLDRFTRNPAGTLTSERLGMGMTELPAESRSIIIPGSVGQPRDNLSNKAKYAVWDPERDQVEIREVAYDVDTTYRLILERGFPETNARRLKW